MLIAHISDFHIFADRPETSLVRPDAEAAARKIVADIAGFTPRFDAVCFTGDLADGGSAADYKLLKDILAPITAPVFVVPGNHDRRQTLREAFPDLPFTTAATLHYESRVGDVRILALDTLVEGQIAGRLDDGQLDWLRARLAGRHGGLTLILMHHPAFISGISTLDGAALAQGRDAFGDIIRPYSAKLRLLSGHIHRPFQGIWNGVFGAVAGSPAFQHRLNLDPQAPEPSAIDEPYAYFIHRLDPAGHLSIHTRYVAI